MAIHQLNPRMCQTAGPGKYEDGGGLRLVVSRTGGKKWVFRLTIRGKRREMGLGSFPSVSLAEARLLAAGARKLVRDDIDPIAARRVEKEKIPSFTTCAARYLRAHRKAWKNPKHGRQWVATLKTYARPVLGAKPVDSISTEDMLKVLSPIWPTKTETASRVRGRIESVLDYAAAHKFRDPLNPARWQGHLDKLLPKPSRIRRVEHHPAMPFDEIARFLEQLRGNNSVSAFALRFLILTATRTGEVRQATWSEINMESKVWTIPADRMKSGREHRVPLSEAAMGVLATVPRVPKSAFVFPSVQSGKAISISAMLMLMRGMGYGNGGENGPYVPHGFRSSFRDWAGEVSSFPRDVVEMALAHVIENKVEAAYRRGDLFDKRRKLMEAWSSYVMRSAVPDSKVIAIR